MASKSSPPIKILSGFSKSLIAVPSAKNSGLDKIEKDLLTNVLLFSDVLSIVPITSAVLTGIVLFSTTIVYPLAYLATSLAQFSIQHKSLAWPAPIPLLFVGVLTEIKIISADSIAL